MDEIMVVELSVSDGAVVVDFVPENCEVLIRDFDANQERRVDEFGEESSRELAVAG